MFVHCKYDDLKHKGAKHRSTRHPMAHSWWLQINQRKQVDFFFFFSYKRSTLLKNCQDDLFLYVAYSRFLESRGVISRYIACCLCFVAACPYVLWWQVLTLSLFGESNIRIHLVILNLVWAVKQVMVLILPALCRTLFMFSLSWNVDWVSPECRNTG